MKFTRAMAAVVALMVSAVIMPQGQAATPVNHYRQQVANLTFTRGDAPAGSRWAPTSDAGDLPASNPYAGQLTVYPTGWGSGANGIYHPETALSVSGGVLNMISHAVNGTVWGANVQPVASDDHYGARTYGRVIYRMRAVGASGHGFAALLWPADDSGKYEFDHEGLLTAGTVSSGYYHYAYHDGAVSWRTTRGQLLSNWHTYENNWWPGGMSFYIDGLLAYTTSNSGLPVPTIPMRWLIQLGRMWGSAPLAEGSTSTVQLAYVKEWAYNS